MISFSSLENFYEECTTGIEFNYEGYWHLIEFDDPFRGRGRVRIHREDRQGCKKYFSEDKCKEYPNLETLVHSYEIEGRTLAQIICDDNGIPRSVLPVHRTYFLPDELFENPPSPKKTEDIIKRIVEEWEKNKGET